MARFAGQLKHDHSSHLGHTVSDTSNLVLSGDMSSHVTVSLSIIISLAKLLRSLLLASSDVNSVSSLHVKSRLSSFSSTNFRSLDFRRSLGPVSLMSAAPSGAVISISSTAITKIWKYSTIFVLRIYTNFKVSLQQFFANNNYLSQER